MIAPTGSVLFECDPVQAPEVGRLLRGRLGGQPRTLLDLGGAPRAVVAKAAD